MLRVSRTEKRSSASILEELGLGSELLNRVIKSKLSFVGRIMRKQGDNLVKTVLQGKMEGTRKRGRPRKQYQDNITTWLDSQMKDVIHATENRRTWRNMVKAAAKASQRQR